MVTPSITCAGPALSPNFASKILDHFHIDDITEDDVDNILNEE
jgi:hypothetical protein